MAHLTFSDANAKTRALARVPALRRYLKNQRRIFSFDLPSGYTCPGADTCLAKAILGQNGKRSIWTGPNADHRCFSASAEAAYPSVHTMRHRNFNALRGLRTTDAMARAILQALPLQAGIVRLHVAGDYFSAAYFRAWLQVARARPAVLFYGYTKSLPYWLDARDDVRRTRNLVLTASYGGKHDALIRSERLRSVKVAWSVAGAGRLPIDHDDSHAADPTRRRQSFALLLHGTQPAGSPAAAAKRALNGNGSYSR